MKKLMFSLLVALVVTSVSTAVAPLVIDDFEGYADDAALQAVWVMNTGSDISTESLEPVLNGTSMLITNAQQGPAYYTQTKLTLPGAVHNDHGVNFTYPGYDAIQMTFAIPPNGGSGPYDNLGGSGGNVFLSMYDCWGGKVFSAAWPGSGSGTGWPNGEVWVMDFASHILAGKNLENVEQITVGYNDQYWSDGALFVDDIILTPEPATIGMLGLGALALIRRKK